MQNLKTRRKWPALIYSRAIRSSLQSQRPQWMTLPGVSRFHSQACPSASPGYTHTWGASAPSNPIGRHGPELQAAYFLYFWGPEKWGTTHATVNSVITKEITCYTSYFKLITSVFLLCRIILWDLLKGLMSQLIYILFLYYRIFYISDSV